MIGFVVVVQFLLLFIVVIVLFFCLKCVLNLTELEPLFIRSVNKSAYFLSACQFFIACTETEIYMGFTVKPGVTPINENSASCKVTMSKLTISRTRCLLAFLQVVGMLRNRACPLLFILFVYDSVFMALSTVFHSINPPDNSPLPPSFTGLISGLITGLISALLVLSTVYLFMKVSPSPDITDISDCT